MQGRTDLRQPKTSLVELTRGEPKPIAFAALSVTVNIVRLDEILGLGQSSCHRGERSTQRALAYRKADRLHMVQVVPAPKSRKFSDNTQFRPTVFSVQRNNTLLKNCH